MKYIPVWVVVLFVAACSTRGVDTASDENGLTFIHMNDTYRIGAVESGRAGGFGRVVSLIRDAQARGRDVRVTHGGDFLYPSLESQLWNGEQMVDALNYIDAVAPLYVVAGNHEFDRRTPEHLINAVRGSEFDWLGDNYYFNSGEADVDAALHRSFIFEHVGYSIGVFALTLHEDHGGNARGYVPIETNYLRFAEQAIIELENKGADLIIGLTHLHMHDDVRISALRRQHPKLLFIVGGHEHELEFQEADESHAAIMKGASNARVVWEIDVDFDARGNPQISRKHHVTVDERIESDAGYVQLENKWRARLLEKFPFLTATVGEAALPLDAREVTIRNVESSWGNFVVDQMRRAFGVPLADLAFINSGTLRIDDYIGGQITFEDVGRTFGFSSFLRYLTISGDEFIRVLEAGFRGEGPSKGYFPQVSGFRVCIDPKRPAGRRIVSLQVPVDGVWGEIDTAKEYSLVATDFVYRGGDGYRFPAEREASKPGSELKYLVLDGIMAAQAQGQKVGAPVDPVNPRIVILTDSDDPCFP